MEILRLKRLSLDPLIGLPVFGGFAITELLDAGGMGSVYLAEHQRICKRVVIKVLHPHLLANDDVVRRFVAEARAASALDHPNIIDVVATDTLPDGRDYIAFEHLAGEPLDAMLDREGPLPPATVLRVLAQVCCGLETAHQRGIVHRDLKPANLFVAPAELRPLRTKILDFGIAKLTDTLLAGGLETATNAVAGTPAYMAPEQARGMRDVDHRADVYSVGAIAYHMLTGQTPYDGDSIGEVVFQQLSGPPTNLRALRPDLPVEWIDAVMSCLGSDPGMRPPSARDLIMRLIDATPYGDAIVREVAPLLFAPDRVERNRAMVAPLAREVAPPPRPGGTATFGPTVCERPRKRRSRLPMLIGFALAALALIAAAVSSLAVATVSAQEPALALAPEPAPEPAPAPAPAPTPAPAPAHVAIDVVLDPPDAALEFNGVLTSARRFELEPGTEISLVARARGYRSERRRFVVERRELVELDLTPAPARPRRRAPERDPLLEVLFVR